jgi:hypothetical protein
VRAEQERQLEVELTKQDAHARVQQAVKRARERAGAAVLNVPNASESSAERGKGAPSHLPEPPTKDAPPPEFAAILPTQLVVKASAGDLEIHVACAACFHVDDIMTVGVRSGALIGGESVKVVGIGAEVVQLDRPLRLEYSIGAPVSKSGIATICAGGCGLHGECDEVNGHCVCNDGFAGARCEEMFCVAHCNQRGLCVAGRCICESGFVGTACERERCPSDCNGKGYCFQDKCVCEGDWGGEDCTVQMHSSTVSVFKLPTKVPALRGAPDKSISSLRSEPLSQECAGNCSGHGALYSSC